MRVLAVVHQEDAGPGVFGEVGGADLVRWIPSGAAPAPGLGEFAAVLVLGGAMNVHERTAHPWLDEVVGLVADAVAARVPVLGVCLGTQLLAQATGGSVARALVPEIGWHDVQLTPEGAADPVVGGLGASFESFQWHSYVAEPPDGAVVLARSAACLQAYRLPNAPAWGIQFHAEVSSADATRWTDDWEHDADAVAMGLDPRVLHAESAQKMEAWHEQGRALFERFLSEARRLRER